MYSIPYTLVSGHANTRTHKAIIAGETNGNGYGILSPTAQNAICDMAMLNPARKLLNDVQTK